MALIVLVTICLLACVFLLFVLVQWTRDTKRKTTTRPDAANNVGEKREEKRPHTVGSRRTAERRDRFKAGSRRLSTVSERSRIRESWYDEREQIAYERIARSFNTSKRV